MSLRTRDSLSISRNVATGGWVQGFFVPSGGVTSLTGLGTIQPFQGEEVEQLREFDQETEFVRVFSDTELRVNDIINGTYEIIKVKGYQRSQGLPHYEAIGVTVTQ